MKVISYAGNEDIAIVYIAETDSAKIIEFVESVQPPLPRNKKWVIIVSTLFGCPIGCPICDAGSFYRGKLTKDEILAQIDFLVNKRFPDGNINVQKFKVQFARMGDPALNQNVLDVLRELPHRYNAPGLMPCISTVAPAGCDNFFEELIDIKKTLYKGKFQMQFSIHTTDHKLRDQLIPVKKWNFENIARYGERFFKKGDRKIALNFALEKNSSIDYELLRNYFDPDKFIIKITPINPTFKASQNRLRSYIDVNSESEDYIIINNLRSAGFEVIVSIGEPDENNIGSNCGQYVMNHLKGKAPISNSYTYKLQKY